MQAHEDALSIILGREVSLLGQSQTEKELRVSPQLRSVRLDSYSMDTEKRVYDSEMESKKKKDLIKKSRYYMSMLDMGLLGTGIKDYSLLKDVCLIMIGPFDLFGYQKCVYTFTAMCNEVPGYELGDQATRIFLNTRGKNREEIPEELRAFLDYIEDTTDETAMKSGSDRILRIHRRVCEVKGNEEKVVTLREDMT